MSETQRDKAVFLDRDGVLNVDFGYVHSRDQLVIPEGVYEALGLMHSSGYRLIVMTNQSGIARGYYPEEAVLALHEHMQELFKVHAGVAIDAFYYCPHHPEGIVPPFNRVCGCRKPGNLLVKQAMERFGIDSSQSYFIGDKESDVACGHSLAMRSFRIASDSLETSSEAEWIVADLLAAAKIICHQKT